MEGTCASLRNCTAPQFLLAFAAASCLEKRWLSGSVGCFERSDTCWTPRSATFCCWRGSAFVGTLQSEAILSVGAACGSREIVAMKCHLLGGCCCCKQLFHVPLVFRPCALPITPDARSLCARLTVVFCFNKSCEFFCFADSIGVFCCSTCGLIERKTHQLPNQMTAEALLTKQAATLSHALSNGSCADFRIWSDVSRQSPQRVLLSAHHLWV